jgi:hypothetical protein
MSSEKESLYIRYKPRQHQADTALNLVRFIIVSQVLVVKHFVSKQKSMDALDGLNLFFLKK